MKEKLWKVIVGSFAVLALSGCAVYSAGVVSNQGKAYVIRSSSFTQDMLLCDASSGQPVCTVQTEN